MQQRLRQPFYGFWGCVTGPVQWGEAIEVTAHREFEKQTGLTASYEVRGFYRKTDFARETDILLEDKLFAIVTATELRGELTNQWRQGFNAWMSLDDFKSKDRYFMSTCIFIDMLTTGQAYSAGSATYPYGRY
ncbi:MAG TPA: NUDIX hydrolase, partial [Verrucomicrobiae bacterium]|nr:NUDIX hydrolase [Verrucomicrobiae bacterium]